MGNAGSVQEQQQSGEREDLKEGAIVPSPVPAVVTFPDAARRNQNIQAPPLKLEADQDSADMAPRNMWQVYALGAFLVLRWAWARMKEKKDRGESPADSSS